MNECENKNLTHRQLHEIIKQNLYNRLSLKTKNKIISNEKMMINDLIPNPIVLKNHLLNVKLTEYTLKEIILNNLDEFLMQLGDGFTYVGNEYKIKFGNIYNYVDLLLFNMNLIVMLLLN